MGRGKSSSKNKSPVVRSLIIGSPSAPPDTEFMHNYPPPPPYNPSDTSYQRLPQSVYMSNVPYARETVPAGHHTVMINSVPIRRTPKHPRESAVASIIIIACSLIAYRCFDERLCIGAAVASFISSDNVPMREIRDLHLYIAGLGAILFLIACCGAHSTADGRTSCSYKFLMSLISAVGFLATAALTWYVAITPCSNNVVLDLASLAAPKRYRTVFEDEFKDTWGIAIVVIDAFSALLLLSMGLSSKN